MQADEASDHDAFTFDSVRIDFWLEDRTRPFFLDVIVAPDCTITCSRFRHEGEAITESLWRCCMSAKEEWSQRSSNHQVPFLGAGLKSIDDMALRCISARSRRSYFEKRRAMSLRRGSRFAARGLY